MWKLPWIVIPSTEYLQLRKDSDELCRIKEMFEQEKWLLEQSRIKEQHRHKELV